MFSEEIYNSLHNTTVHLTHTKAMKIEKDSNNNSNINNSTISTKVKPNKIDKQNNKNTKEMINENATMATKEKKNVKISDAKSSIVTESSSGTNTLKRKRESKSPIKSLDSQPEESNKKQSSSSSQTIATILVSKTKTKSGLPLLLKK